MAKKKSKTVKKASNSRSSKKKTAKKSSAARGRSTAKRAAKKKPASKKVTKKKVAKKTTKKTVASKKTSKKAPAKKSPAKTASTKASTRKVVKKASAGAKASSASPAKKKVVRRKSASVPFKRTAGPKPSSIASPPPSPHVNGESVEWTPAKLRRVKTGLTRKDINYFLALLLERRAEIMGDVAGLEAARRAQDGDISHVPLHMADVGSDNYEQEFTLGLMETERKMVIEIDEAIARIQDKTYGVCIESGTPIPRERLEIKPWAKYTIDVVRERERLGMPV